MKIKVEQRHISSGVECDSGNCPLALALIEATGERWSVSPTHATRFAASKTFELPDNAQDFISRFDCWGAVIPFEFEIEL